MSGQQFTRKEDTQGGHTRRLIEALERSIENYNERIHLPQDPTNEGETTTLSVNQQERIARLTRDKELDQQQLQSLKNILAEREAKVQRAQETDRRRGEIQRELAAFEERNRCCSIQ